MQLAAILLGLAALGGLLMVGMLMRGTPRPPTSLALGHGAIAAAGLAAFAYAAATQALPTMAIVSLCGFVLAALGGATIFVGFHLKEKPLPMPLVLGHGATAVASYVLLLVAMSG